jgi:lipoprotein-anchoring transpeptidase ErfK/SrfK
MKKVFIAILVITVSVVGYYFFPESKIPENKSVDKILIFKNDHKMEVYSGDELLKTYSISHVKKVEGQDPEDDRSVPVGNYFVFDKEAKSKYRKSIGFDIGEVNPEVEIETGKKRKKKTGFRIHGMKRGYGFIGKFHRWTDWTKGGIAVTDEEIDDLFSNVEIGLPVLVQE